jgi:DivIVA domain-containing protein
VEQVDAFLDAVRDTLLGVRRPPLTAEEIRAKQFATTRLRPGYDEEEVDAFLGEAEARLRVRCAECGAESAEVAQVCVVCGAPAVGRPPGTADPAGGGPGEAAAVAAARDAAAGTARARRRYLLLFLACCVMLPIIGFVSTKVPPTSDLAGWVGGAFAVSVGGALAFLVAFVRTLGRWRRARVRQVVWALVPVVSLAWLAWWPFLVLALIRRRARDWAVFAAYLAAVAAAETVLIVVSGQDVAAANRLGWLIVPPLALTAAIHTLVAFRPGAELPTLWDVEAARAAAKRQQPVMDAGGSEDWH